MTNVRITADFAAEWVFCPYCGRRLEHDQSPDLLVWGDDGIQAEASFEAGYRFANSLASCGYHIRLWVPDDGELAIE